jgi:GT2 family glycosyltransferase
VTPSEPRVSIVCVTYGRRDFALRCLESCVTQDYVDLEVIAVVNPSGDGTEQAIADRLPQVRLMRAHRNLGFFTGLNLAIANATGDYVMTVDDDAYFLSRDAIRRLVAAMRREPQLGAVTCNLEGPTESPMTGGDRYVHLYTTGFTLMPRKVFTEWIGYYPDGMFAGGESFMCADLWDRGLRVKRVTDVRMFHAKTQHGRYGAWVEDTYRSQARYAIEKEPLPLVLPSLASKFARSFVQACRARRVGAWIRIWAEVVTSCPAALRKRKPIRWRTQRLLWRLRRDTVRDVEALAGHS